MESGSRPEATAPLATAEGARRERERAEGAVAASGSPSRSLSPLFMENA